MYDYRAKPSIMALLALSLALAGCSKSPVEAAPEQTAPEPVVEKVEPVSQAETLAKYIDERPECASFREPLTAASPTATSAELVAILEQAHKAGCTKKKQASK